MRELAQESDPTIPSEFRPVAGSSLLADPSGNLWEQGPTGLKQVIVFGLVGPNGERQVNTVAVKQESR